MVIPHRSVGGHVGGSGGRGYGRARTEELLTCIADRLGDRGSAGKASPPTINDESANANTASRQKVAPGSAPVANDRPVNVPIRSTTKSVIDRFQRKILNLSRKIISICPHKMAHSHACKDGWESCTPIMFSMSDLGWLRISALCSAFAGGCHGSWGRKCISW